MLISLTASISCDVLVVAQGLINHYAGQHVGLDYLKGKTGCHGGCLTSKRLHKLVLPADSASRCNINISVNFMVKHVEMQKGVHFTIVCAIFLIGFKKTL